MIRVALSVAAGLIGRGIYTALGNGQPRSRELVGPTYPPDQVPTPAALDAGVRARPLEMPCPHCGGPALWWWKWVTSEGSTEYDRIDCVSCDPPNETQEAS